MRVAVAALACLILASCYTPRKAKISLGKAVTTYPEVGQEYCAITYPPKTNYIKGDTITKVDTFYSEGSTMYDTIRSIKNDTIRIIKTIQLPGTKIIERSIVHDTAYIENTAALELARGDARRAVALATDKTAEADKWRKIARKRFWIIAGMGAGLALGLFLFIRRKVTKIIPK